MSRRVSSSSQGSQQSPESQPSKPKNVVLFNDTLSLKKAAIKPLRFAGHLPPPSSFAPPFRDAANEYYYSAVAARDTIKELRTIREEDGYLSSDNEEDLKDMKKLYRDDKEGLKGLQEKSRSRKTKSSHGSKTSSVSSRSSRASSVSSTLSSVPSTTVPDPTDIRYFNQVPQAFHRPHVSRTSSRTSSSASSGTWSDFSSSHGPMPPWSGHNWQQYYPTPPSSVSSHSSCPQNMRHSVPVLQQPIFTPPPSYPSSPSLSTVSLVSSDGYVIVPAPIIIHTPAHSSYASSISSDPRRRYS